MWSLEILEDGILVVKRVYKNVEDAIRTIGLRYYEKNDAYDIQVHLGYVRIRKEK